MNKYAVIKIKDKQYFVEEGDVIVTHPVNKEDILEVLLLKDAKTLELGEPTVKTGGVLLSIVDNKKIKTEVRRYRSKSRYRKNRSHGQLFSYLKIDSIDLGLKNSKISFKEEKEAKKVTKTKSTVSKKKISTKKSAVKVPKTK